MQVAIHSYGVKCLAHQDSRWNMLLRPPRIDILWPVAETTGLRPETELVEKILITLRKSIALRIFNFTPKTRSCNEEHPDYIGTELLGLRYWNAIDAKSAGKSPKDTELDFALRVVELLKHYRRFSSPYIPKM